MIVVKITQSCHFCYGNIRFRLQFRAICMQRDMPCWHAIKCQSFCKHNTFVTKSNSEKIVPHLHHLLPFPQCPSSCCGPFRLQQHNHDEGISFSTQLSLGWFIQLSVLWAYAHSVITMLTLSQKSLKCFVWTLCTICAEFPFSFHLLKSNMVPDLHALGMTCLIQPKCILCAVLSSVGLH